MPLPLFSLSSATFSYPYQSFRVERSVSRRQLHSIRLTAAANSTSTSPSPPPIRRALGVDYGRKQIGLAVSTLGLAPRPIASMRGGGLAALMQMAQNIVQTAIAEGCDAIVIGLPVTQAGALRRRHTDSQQGRRCRNFADAVAAIACSKGLQVFLVDETGTTVEAESLMYMMGGRGDEVKRKKDSVAAALILSAYFNDPSEAVLVREPRILRNSQNMKNIAGSSSENIVTSLQESRMAK